MALVDDVTIKVIAGRGGNGGNSRSNLYGSTKVFADGGNGGNGGNVYFKASNNVSDLSQFRFQKVIKADNGDKGMNKNLDGKKAQDIYVLVPLGTKIINAATHEEIEMEKVDETVLIAKGGQGGRGTHDLKFALGFDEAITGKSGEEKELRLVLSLIAQIGLIGLPNAGKSSLLATLTNANPKIGSYPFTTIEPNLGVFEKIVIADIPGLIEGASHGRGLGTTFLKHIEKTKVLFHCVDVTSLEIETAYKTVRDEFKDYSDGALLKKDEIILLTKIDLVNQAEIKKQTEKLKKFKRKIVPVSIYEEKGLNVLKRIILSYGGGKSHGD